MSYDHKHRMRPRPEPLPAPTDSAVVSYDQLWEDMKRLSARHKAMNEELNEAYRDLIAAYREKMTLLNTIRDLRSEMKQMQEEKN